MTHTIKRQRSVTLDRALLALALIAWLAGFAGILAHKVFVTNDSLSNYGHVWYVAKVFWDGDGLPYRFPELGHGDALAFPYGFVPWFTAALLRPLFGDWVVSLWLVLGGLGTIVTSLWAFPELRRPLPFTLILLNPLMIESVILGQLPFLWATAIWFAAIAFWRREHTWLAVIAAAVAQASHPAVVLPLAGLTVLGRLPFERNWRRLFAAYCVSVALAIPGVAMVFLSPVVEDNSLYSLVANFLGTVSLRAGVSLAPFAIIALDRRLERPWMLGLIAVTMLLNVVLVPVRNTSYAWHAFGRTPDTALIPFIESSAFESGATYRILRVADGKVGMYQLLQHGAKLDSEFFPESINRRSWDSLAEYQAFLRRRKADFVIIYFAYDDRYRTNEHQLLNQLVADGCATRSSQSPDFDLYRVNRDCR